MGSEGSDLAGLPPAGLPLLRGRAATGDHRQRSVRHHVGLPQDPGIQRAYYELAEAYGFCIEPCPPRRPELKGRVESGIKYVKRSFLPGREFRNLADANRQLRTWVLEEAVQRLHGTTRERPLTRFAEVEKALMTPLPSRAYEPSQWKQLKLGRDGHVRFDQGSYSAPWIHIGERLWVRAMATRVQIFRDHELVASHTRCRRPGECRTVVDHLPPEAQAFQRQTPLWCREQAGGGRPGLPHGRRPVAQRPSRREATERQGLAEAARAVWQGSPGSRLSSSLEL